MQLFKVSTGTSRTAQQEATTEREGEGAAAPKGAATKNAAKLTEMELEQQDIKGSSENTSGSFEKLGEAVREIDENLRESEENFDAMVQSRKRVQNQMKKVDWKKGGAGFDATMVAAKKDLTAAVGGLEVGGCFGVCYVVGEGRGMGELCLDLLVEIGLGGRSA